MELKRVVARDTRAATEKAIALYGKDMLVISNQHINGQIELVVAVDPEPTPASINRMPVDKREVPVSNQEPPPAKRETPSASFDDVFDQVRQYTLSIPPLPDRRRQASAPQPTPAPPPARTAPPLTPIVTAEVSPPIQASPTVDSKELLDRVCQEIAALRTELQRGGHPSYWPNHSPISRALQPIVHALNETGISARFKASLLDSMCEEQDMSSGMQALQRCLTDALPRPENPSLQPGMHVLCGPSGSGKTSMAARLARSAAQETDPGRIAIIGFKDERSGAWNQLQILASQAGVACYRANDLSTLQLLLEELRQHHWVLIDTSGSTPFRDIEPLRHCGQTVAMHAVLPADTSHAVLRRFRHPDLSWNSIMVSKVDEAEHPWPMIECLSDGALPVSVLSDQRGVEVPARPFDQGTLARAAINGLEWLIKHPQLPRTAPIHTLSDQAMKRHEPDRV